MSDQIQRAQLTERVVRAQVWLGYRIRDAREGACMTQARLAAEIFELQSTVSRWETGRAAPTFEQIVKISYALRVSLSALFDGID